MPVVTPARRALGITAGLLLLSALGCARSERLPPPRRPAPVPSVFNPVEMRLHPTFTRLKSWTVGPDANPAKPDGVEAEVGFYDRFGDPVKAEGRIIFEIHQYRTDSADFRGRRVTNPFVGSLVTDDDQRARWNPATRTYRFQLFYPKLDPERSYVLSATFDPKAGERFFSRIILQPSMKPTPAAAAK